MRVFLTGFLFFLLFAIPARWYFVCELRHHCGDAPAPLLPSRAKTLTLKDGETIVLQGYEQFSFPLNSAKPDLTPNNEEFLQKVAAYLNANPGKNISLTGRYLESEKGAKSGIFENLGIARAAEVEALLEKLGVDGKRFSIDYQMVSGTAIGEPVSFNLYDPKPSDYDRPTFKFTDNTFSDANFAFGSDQFAPGEQCILYADSVKSYLANNPNFLLTVIGHTDSIGTSKANYNLGLRRAKNAAQYFRELGVKAEIVTSSKGEEQPVAPNTAPNGKDNPEGRQKNRRVNFKIEEKTTN